MFLPALRICSWRAEAICSGMLPAYSSSRAVSLANWAGFIWAAEIPEACPLRAARRPLEVRMSAGALGSTMAVLRCSAVRAVIRSRPRSSSAARTRRPARGPTRTSAREGGGGRGSQEGGLTLFGGESGNQVAAQVFLGGQDAQAGARSYAHFGGIGAEETRGVDHAAVDHGIVLAEVVALDAIAPGSGIARCAEDGEVVFFGVAPLARVLFQDAQDVFQAHDGDRLHVARLAEAGAQQGACQMALEGGHFAQRQPLALNRDEEPVEALGVIELESGLGPLLGRERCQEAVRGFGHHRCGTGAVVGGSQQNGADRDGTQAQEKRFHGPPSVSSYQARGGKKREG